jgi:C-terminal processing protease CtpA/Prc
LFFNKQLPVRKLFFCNFHAFDTSYVPEACLAMRTLYLIIYLLYPITLTTAQENQLKGDSLLTDFHILKTTLEENHPLMFDYLSKTAFYTLCDSLENNIKQAPSIPQFQSSVNKLLSAIGCGHTYCYPAEFLKPKLKQPNDLPFEVRVLDTVIFVSKIYTKELQLLPGEQIISINTIRVKDLIHMIYREMSSDGSNATHKEYLLQKNFNDYLNTILHYPGSLNIETTSQVFTINYPTLFSKPAPKEEAPSFATVNGSKNTVLLKLPDFDERKNTIKKCFAYLDKQHTANLIIDLRGNGGGNGNIAAYLLSYLLDTTATYYLDKKTKPFKYKQYLKNNQGFLLSNQFVYKDSTTKSYYFKIRPKAKHHYTGKVYVLADGGTFSSAAFAASLLKHKVRAVFIGRETGGSEYAIGGGVIGKLLLPYSGLAIKFPLYKWDFNAVPTNTGKGVIPDFPIWNNGSISSGTDPELAKAMELINKK